MRMRPWGIALLAAALVPAASAQDLSSPAATVRSFVAAIEKGELGQASACVVGGQASPLYADLSQQIRKQPPKFTIIALKVSGAGAGAGSTARATLVVSATGMNGPTSPAQTIRSDLNLKLVGKAWKIVPGSPAALENPRNQPPDVFGMMAAMVAHPDALTRARDVARATSCLSNIKQLAVACLMLAQDHNGTLAVQPGALKRALTPYVKNDRVFSCPATRGGAISYSLNAALAGLPLSRVQSPAETVLLYEGAGGKLVFRHGGRAVVAFVDGHAKLLDESQAAQLRWKP